MMKACLLGSTGVVAETGRLERLAYNAAFDELGLDLYWNVATYCKLLEIPGGLRRLESIFGDEWLAGLTDEVFALQQKHFDRLAENGLRLRPGIAELIEYCQRNGISLGWVTTAPQAMLDTLARCTEGLDLSCFDLVCSREDSVPEKPDPTVYYRALDLLDLHADDVIAIEDSPAGQTSALAAELQCYLYPGEYSLVENNVLVTRDVSVTVERVHTLWSTHDQRMPVEPLQQETLS